MVSPSNDIEALKTHLRRLIRDAPWGTQRKLAKACGLSGSRISEFASGGTIGLDALSRAAAYFNIDTTFLWYSNEGLTESSESSKGSDQIRQSSAITSLPHTGLPGGDHASEVEARIRQLESENDTLRSLLSDIRDASATYLATLNATLDSVEGSPASRPLPGSIRLRGAHHRQSS